MVVWPLLVNIASLDIPVSCASDANCIQTHIAGQCIGKRCAHQDLTTCVQMAHNLIIDHPESAMTTLAKDTRLHIRCDQEVRRLLDKAAAYAHMSVSEFVLRNAVEQARSVVQAHEAITLSQDDFAAFLDALDRPAQANPALQRAFARYTKHVR